MTPKVEDRQQPPRAHGLQCVAGVNDLASLKPELAAQWHPTKNNSLTPEMVSVKSGKKVWWVCARGHEWDASVAHRAEGTDCPVCSSRAVVVGENDLATLKPEVAVSWHPTMNGSLTPEMVTLMSNRKVWWVCDLGHEWDSRVASRARGAGCPICSGNNVLAGVNDLATLNPELAASWHPTKNGSLTPEMVSLNSTKKAWWVCALGHEWASYVSGRAQGNGCPVCAGQAVLAGYNDLASLKPELAAQWHPKKNGSLTPEMVSLMSSKKVWWVCALGHEWAAPVGGRTLGTGCPRCAKGGFDQSSPAVLYFLFHPVYQSRKVGITMVDGKRLPGFVREGWKILFTFSSEDGGLIHAIESSILAWIRKDLGLPAHLGPREMGQRKGWSETFSADGPSDSEVIDRITSTIAELSL